MTTADQFHPGEPGGTTYGDVSDAEGIEPGGEAPQDESAFDEDASADAPGDGDDIYANPEVDPTEPVTDGEDG